MSIFDEGISVATLVATIISVFGGILGTVSMIRTLKERKIYSRQVRSLFIEVLNYSLASNESLLNLLLTSGGPVKTYEIYSLEIEAMKSNLLSISKVDLSRVTDVYQNNIQSYLYQYRRYTSNVEEYLIRLRKRSDYIKEVMEGKHEFRSIHMECFDGDSNEAMKEFLSSEYGIDYILVEEEGIIKQNFISFLKEGRALLKEILNTVEKEQSSEKLDMQSLYEELLEENKKIETEKK